VTLVLNSVTRGRIFHASDRLVTLQSRGSQPVRTWTSESNKTIVVVGTDCWLVLGCSGLAYLAGKPTDQYLAEAISGIPDLSAGAFVTWRAPRDLHFREILDRIEFALDAAYAQLPPLLRLLPTEVAGVGLQRARRPRHLVFWVESNAGNARTKNATDRHQSQFRFRFHASGTTDRADFDAVSARLASEGAESPEKFRRILIEGVAHAGRNSPVIGEDVMSVLAEPTANRVHVHFQAADPAARRSAQLKTTLGGETISGFPTVATPYVLAPGWIFCPSIATPGGWTVEGQGFHYEFTGDGLDSPVARLFHGSQKRRRRPA